MRSRRERPAKPALTRDGIITTALSLLRGEGLDRVTMRRLAQELDTGPASLYVYVRNTAELHAAVLDELIGAVDLNPPAGSDWRRRLVQVLTSYIEVLFEYPALARSSLLARPSGAHYLDLVEALLALLGEGGVGGAQAAWGVDLLLLFATATAAEQSSRERSRDAEHEWQVLTAALAGATAQRHPHLSALRTELQAGAPGDRLRWAFEALIRGIEQAPTPVTGSAAGPETGAVTGRA